MMQGQGQETGVKGVPAVCWTTGWVQQVGPGLYVPQQSLVSRERSVVTSSQGPASVNRVVELSLGRQAK
jgi:hypothetical protein